MRTPTALVALVLLTSGCATEIVSGNPGPSGTPVPLTAPTGQVVLAVEVGGGMTPADAAGYRRPGMVVFGNGDAYLLTSDYTGARPLAVQRGRIARADLVDLVADAGGSGLFTDADFGEPQITDSPTTSLRLRPGAGPATGAAAYALAESGDDTSLTRTQLDNRRRLRTLLERITDSVRTPAAWTPPRVAVSEGYQDADDRALDWPGPALAGVLSGRDDTGRACGVVAGATARRVYELARTEGTGRWDDGTTTTNLVISPLLPGERGCRSAR